MARVWNFSAGPAALPTAVLERARAELLEHGSSGMSVMEMSHRSAEFVALKREVERKLRAAAGIPDAHRVLFLQGGASLQFAMVPLNLMGGKGASYAHTGHWGTKAIEEAKRIGRVALATDSKANRFTDVAPVSAWAIDDDAAYLHYTPNETIAGVEFHQVPAVGLPLVADLSSSILSRPFDFAAHALTYAGAQKNMGPAGLTVVVLREDALRDLPSGTASMLDYRAHLAAPDGMLNTPPTYSVYLLGLVLDWLAEQGGVAAMAERNAAKAAALYAYIDGSGFYRNPVAPAWRSRMNVPFLLDVPEADKARLEAAFLEGTRAAGLANLEGHRSVGGMRASLYNAMPLEGVQSLVQYMREFARTHG
jgi:phosphoserine aminotransferase